MTITVFRPPGRVRLRRPRQAPGDSRPALARLPRPPPGFYYEAATRPEPRRLARLRDPQALPAWQEYDAAGAPLPEGGQMTVALPEPPVVSFLSICSGIEAASVALEPLGFAPVAFAETDRDASAVLAHRFQLEHAG